VPCKPPKQLVNLATVISSSFEQKKHLTEMTKSLYLDAPLKMLVLIQTFSQLSTFSDPFIGQELPAQGQHAFLYCNSSRRSPLRLLALLLLATVATMKSRTPALQWHTICQCQTSSCSQLVAAAMPIAIEVSHTSITHTFGFSGR
jgi:hypothetical protein